MKDVFILSIETSCDETSVAVVKNGREVLSNVISSQIKVHEVYGGVVPEIASRKHIEQIDIVLAEAVRESGAPPESMDAIAVVCGPGLVGALLVGVSYAKGLSYALKKPLIAVHHIEGHIHANFLENDIFEPPFICLVVSGGHTSLVYMGDYTSFEVLGGTCDDAAGEAFDKVARALGLGYPGGPAVDRLAKEGDPNKIAFPRAYLGEGSFDFSFSGLKSSVLNYKNNRMSVGEEADICASFQKAVIEVLVNKTIKAAKTFNVKRIALAGGVCCNSYLRSEMTKAADGYELNIPKPMYCTDNAAMIGARGYHDYLAGRFSGLELNAYPTLKIGEGKLY